MKRITTVVAIACACACSTAFAQDPHVYGWTISDSNTNSRSNQGPDPAGATIQLYLWLECVTVDGMSSMEADLAAPAGATIVAFTPQNGFLNAGSPTYLLLAVGGCPGGPGGTAIPIVAGFFFILNAQAGEYCLVPSQATNTLATVDCSITPTIHPIRQIGYGAGQAPSCDQSQPQLCEVAVEATSWGDVKSLYR